MAKFDSLTVAISVAILCFIVVSLLGLVGWLYRSNQRMIKERLEAIALTSAKAEIKTSTNEANIKANRDLFDKALEVAELRGQVMALQGMLIGYTDELVKQSKDYALGAVRRHMHGAISQEVKAQLASLGKEVGEPHG